MLVDSVAGAFLVAGAAACAGAAVRGRRSRPGRAGLALALALAGAGELADLEWALIAGCGLATVAIALLVLGAARARRPAVVARRRSWAPPRPPGSPWRSARAPSSRSAPAAWPPASACAAGSPGGPSCSRSPALPRWRPARGSPRSRRVAMGAAAWLPRAPPRASDEFSPIVLAAILDLRHDRAVPAHRRAVHRHRPGRDRARHRHRADRHGTRRSDRGRAAARDAARRRSPTT